MSPAILESIESAERRCYVLDESHRVIMICAPLPDDVRNARFVRQESPLQLHPVLSRAVRDLELACATSSERTISGVLGTMRLRVKLLHGSWGRHTTLIVEPIGDAA